MISNSEKSEIFLASINKEADRQCAKIKEDTDKYISLELQKARTAAQTDVKILKKDETDRLNEENNAGLSELEANETKFLVGHRKDLTEKVFDKALREITEFTQKYEYLLFLKKSIANIKNSIGEDATVILRPDDRKYEKDLLKLCEAVEYDDTIVLGGCRGINRRTKLTADDTVDVRFEQAKQNFYLYSKLSITL